MNWLNWKYNILATKAEILSSPAQHFLPDTTSSVVKTKNREKKQNKKILNLEKKKKKNSNFSFKHLQNLQK